MSFKKCCLGFTALFVFLWLSCYGSAEAANISYHAHVANIGWQGWVNNGRTAGTTGRSLQMEAVEIKVSEGGITYRAHVANIGWQGWVSNGRTAGTTGRGLQMEAVEIKLTNGLQNQFDVEYRAHVANIGWQGWVSNGQTAGTTGRGLRMEALEIRLVPKGGGNTFEWPVPGYTRITQKNAKGHSCRYSYGGKPAGIDISVPVGTSVKAPAAGTVITVKDVGNRSFGKYMEIKHDDGTITLYAHLSAFSARQGQRVSQGTVIAKSGNSGGSTGPHLHYEMTKRDIYQYYAGKGVLR